MAEYGPNIFDLQENSGQDLSAARYVFVRHTTTKDQIALATDPTTPTAIGVLQDDPSSLQNCRVRPIGLTKVVAGAAVSYGALVTHDSSGRATAAGSADWCYGRALEAAGAAGQIISVLLWGSPVYIPASCGL